MVRTYVDSNITTSKTLFEKKDKLTEQTIKQIIKLQDSYIFASILTDGKEDKCMLQLVTYALKAKFLTFDSTFDNFSAFRQDIS